MAKIHHTKQILLISFYFLMCHLEYLSGGCRKTTHIVCVLLWGMGTVRFWVYESWGRGALCTFVLHSLKTIMTDISMNIWGKRADHTCQRVSVFVYNHENSDCMDRNSWNFTYDRHCTPMMVWLFTGRQWKGFWKGDGVKD